MGVILGLGSFWTLYGIAGLLGFQIIGEKYQNHPWTKRYIRFRGVSWLILGIPFLMLYFLPFSRQLDRPVLCLLILICGLPSILYSFVGERKYRRIRQEE